MPKVGRHSHGMGGTRRERDGIRPKVVASSIDEVIAALAARQHGVVATSQLVTLGLSRRAVSHRAGRGRLHRVHRGVYAVGHRALSRDGHRMAAVLAAGPGAALSHAAAGALWELRPSAATRIDVSVPTAGGRAHGAIRIHRVPGLMPAEVTTVRGIPVTSAARTVLDLAAILQPRRLERVLDEAESRALADVRDLDAMARAHPGHRRAPRLLRTLATHTPGTTLTRSELEERFLDLCAAHRLERPRVNVRVEGLEVDFLFAAERLVVETDGYRHHRTRAAFERDRARDAALARAGYRVLRFSHRQLADEPAQVVAALRPPRPPRPPTSSSR
jgi:very-short-patch-repair endonuclease/predicted transcriptional regulator of viral defense system